MELLWVTLGLIPFSSATGLISGAYVHYALCSLCTIDLERRVGEARHHGRVSHTTYSCRWAREAEIKHGRVAMLAATGMIVQDLYKFPGFEGEFGGAAMMKLHNLAVEQGAMQQLLLWVGLLETLTGVPAIIQTLNGSERAVSSPASSCRTHPLCV